jgi:hypothetical protein
VTMEVSGTPILVPGTLAPSRFPLARYRYPALQGVVSAFARSTTQRGDVLLALGAISSETVREVVGEQRRIVALGRNPVDLLCTALDLEATPSRGAQVQAALTQLGDLPKGGRPLILHMQSQYESRCPHCHQKGTAEWFAWDRERGRPFAKRVACPQCGQAHEGPVDAVDVERAGRYPVRSGPVYHLALNRAAGQDAAVVARTTQLIELYTPRNLSTLMTIVQRMPQLQSKLRSDTADLRALHALLFEAFDAGSALTPYETPAARPRSLRAPQQFLERNVWMVLEQAASDYQAHCERECRLHPTGLGPEATGLRALLGRRDPGYLLLGRSVQSLRYADVPVKVSGVILHLVPPDAVFWALAVLWSLWLWGEEAPSDLRLFLQRRRLDWDWYQRSITAALSAVQPYLAPAAPILTLSSGSEPEVVRALTVAARQSGTGVDHWIAVPPNGYRIVLHAGTAACETRTTEDAPAPAGGTDIAVQILRERGEPLQLPRLQAAVLLQCANPSAVDLDISAAGPLTTLSKTHVWLQDPSQAALPLGDRLERAILRHLTSTPSWTYNQLMGEVYRKFNGPLSPEPELVEAIVSAYTVSDTAGQLSLRLEDNPHRRRREAQQLNKNLRSLGAHLGYYAVRRMGGDIVWREEGDCSYLFRLTSSAILAPHLLKPPPRCDGRCCLIVPGGRAALIALRLRRDPRLMDQVESHQWTFIKFRHLRRMIEEITDRTEIEVFLGLDPIVEQEGAQIPLPLPKSVQQRRAGE